MARVAIIPARGGSKRIPKKNIKLFLGRPIISYVIEVALQSKLFDNVVVSTDSKEIADIAIQYGASVPFFRKPETSNDFATLNDVFVEVIDELKLHGKHYEYACLILPTAALITPENLQKGLDLLEKSNHDSIRPIVRFAYPIQRAFKLNTDQSVEPFNPEDFKKRSQDLEASFHDSGQFYWMKQGKDMTTKKLGFEISELEAQDIDTETDWKLAELKYQLLHS